MTVNEALAVTFPDVSIKHGIGIGLFKNTLTTLGTARHQRFIDAAWNNKVSILVGSAVKGWYVQQTLYQV